MTVFSRGGGGYVPIGGTPGFLTGTPLLSVTNWDEGETFHGVTVEGCNGALTEHWYVLL